VNPVHTKMHVNVILSLELGVFGGLITPVCSCMLSERILCHSTAFVL
jgi:hypothetical protein